MNQPDLFGEGDAAIAAVPFAKGSATSRASAAAFKEHAGNCSQRVLDEIARCGKHGATCCEIERSLKMRHQTASGRITVLRLAGKVQDSGNRRQAKSGRNVVVWEAVL